MTNNGDLKDVKHCPMAHTHPGSAEQVVVAGFMGPFTVFCECGVRGPYRCTREAAIDAWNAMPRALQDDKWIRWEDRIPVKGEAGYVVFRDDLNGRVWIQEGTTVVGEWWHYVPLAWLPRPALPF